MKLNSLRLALMVMLLVLFGALGTVWAANSQQESSPHLTPDKWIGQSFTFLSLPAADQAAGYEIFDVELAKQGFNGDHSARIPYAQNVSKQVTVTDVVTYIASDNQYEYIIYLEENESKQKLVGRTSRGQLEGLVLTSDLAKAQKQFLGKTVYVKLRTIEGLYDPQTITKPLSIPTKIGSAVNVVDVYAGMKSSEPIWLIVVTDNQKAFIPITYSLTNVPSNFCQQDPPWQEKVMLNDFRATSGWSEELWNQIDAGIVNLGMTSEQVRFSWGAPASISQHATDPNVSIWKYGTKTLNFSGDKLTSIESEVTP
ncbi:MAG: hypothetical protein H6Q72_2426 [Firmicutes bacterium]|nr:hypothetical protein [Bacillota bacterium]